MSTSEDGAEPLKKSDVRYWRQQYNAVARESAYLAETVEKQKQQIEHLTAAVRDLSAVVRRHSA